jgi:hypothetical protein
MINVLLHIALVDLFNFNRNNMDKILILKSINGIAVALLMISPNLFGKWFPIFLSCTIITSVYYINKTEPISKQRKLLILFLAISLLFIGLFYFIADNNLI